MPIKVVPGSITVPYKIGKGDFSPNLVGQQFTQGSTIFTLGNFEITTNLSAPLSRVYNTGSFSESYCLENLELTEQESEILSNESLKVILNIDPNDLSRYAYFGSFYEFLKTNIQTLILKWKGSLYVNSLIPSDITATPKNTVLNYSYDSVTNISKFSIPITTIINNFGLIYDENTTFIGTEYGNIANLNFNYLNYQVTNIFGDFFVLGFSGSGVDNNYINVEVRGNSWPGIETIGFGMYNYHVQPKEEVLNKYFFNLLDEFENNILNRLTEPKYTISVKVPKKTDSGSEFLTKIAMTWPTSDGYNLDINGGSYDTYINSWLNATKSIDEYKANLITRRFITASIIEFDTDGGGDERYGRKVDKLLKIYGREFDEIKQHIDAISFARVVTYNKKDNTPDELIKILAGELGLDVLLSFFDNNLFGDVLPNNSTSEGYGNISQVPFSGYSRNLSPKEMDIELWRRLVVNAWWLFKSKGHRKVLEFFLSLFGIENCAITLDEYIYIAKNRLNVNETLQAIADYLGESDTVDIDTATPATASGNDINDLDLSNYPMDEYGFPKVPLNTPDYYYQLNGFWYNGGNLSEKGNNPHLGPYDYGKAYFDRLRCFIDDFNGQSTGTTTFNTIDNLFTDYENGTIESGVADYGENYAQIINDSNRISPNATVSLAGASNDIVYGNSDTSLRITFLVGESNCSITCPTDLTYYSNGVIFANELSPTIQITDETIDNLFLGGIFYDELVLATQITEECCDEIGGFYLPINILSETGPIDGPIDDTKPNAIITSLAPQLTLLPPPLTSPSDGLNDNGYFTIEELFDNSENEQDEFVCYWCPPIKILCGEDYYISVPQSETKQDIIVVDGDKDIVGCTDPTALNYNALTTLSCGPSGPYEPDLGGQLTSGCCIKNSTGPSGDGDIDINIDIDIEPLPCVGTYSITLSGVVLLNGVETEQSCCTQGLVGSDVEWVDGQCVLTTQINPPKCQTNNISITPSGVVLGVNTEECCTKDVVGQEVNWNGKQCTIFNKEFCVIISVDGQNITDPKCCKLRGGYITTDTAGNIICVQQPVSDFTNNNQTKCPITFTQQQFNATDDSNIVYTEVISFEGDKLSEICCKQYANQYDQTYYYDPTYKTCLKSENLLLNACRYQLIESFAGITYNGIYHSGESGIYSLDEKVTIILKKLIVNGVDYLQTIPTYPTTVLDSTTSSPNDWNSVLFLQKIFNEFNLINYKAQLPGTPINITNPPNTPNSRGNETFGYPDGYGFYIIKPATDTFEIELSFYTESEPPLINIGEIDRFIFVLTDIDSALGGTSTPAAPSPRMVLAECGYEVDKTITPSNETCFVVTNTIVGSDPQQCYPYTLDGKTYE